jgi:hypothetical protein
MTINDKAKVKISSYMSEKHIKLATILNLKLMSIKAMEQRVENFEYDLWKHLFVEMDMR